MPPPDDNYRFLSWLLAASPDHQHVWSLLLIRTAVGKLDFDETVSRVELPCGVVFLKRP